jgi:outer membrane protein assembly factor BamB
MVLAALVFPLRPGASPAHAAVGAASAWAAAWSMVGHDPQRTNRSGSLGPLHPHLLFTVAGLAGPPLIGANGDIYGVGRGGLTAVNASGRLLWTARFEGGNGGQPVLTPNGLLIANGFAPAASATVPNALAMDVGALSPTGTLAWRIPSLGFSKGVAPLVTAGNSVYMPYVGPHPANFGIGAVSSTGAQRRLLPQDSAKAIARGQGGTIYALGTQGAITLRALSPSGVPRWTQPLPYQDAYYAGVLVGKDGVIYVSDGAKHGRGTAGEVVAYAPSGRQLWRLPGTGVAANLAERADGTVLTVSGSELRAIAPNGHELWTAPLGGLHSPTGYAQPSLAVDAAGHAYVGGRDGTVRAFSAMGKLLWTLHLPSSLGGVPSLALSADGRLVVAGADGLLRIYQ